MKQKIEEMSMECTKFTNHLKCPFRYDEDEQNKNMKLMTLAIYNDRHRYLNGYDVQNEKENKCICLASAKRILKIYVNLGTFKCSRASSNKECAFGLPKERREKSSEDEIIENIDEWFPKLYCNCEVSYTEKVPYGCDNYLYAVQPILNNGHIKEWKKIILSKKNCDDNIKA